MLESRKVALVTGGSSGIGQAVAAELARRGVIVYAASRSLPDCPDSPDKTECEPAAVVRTIRLDVNDAAGCERAVSRIIAAEGRLDYLVQSAGFGIAGAVEDTSLIDARSQMETNFFGSVSLLPYVLPVMRSQHSGLIVNIGSVAGFLPVPFQAYYSASKAAVAALTCALANEVRPYGIRCQLVQPGDTRTGFTGARVVIGNEASAYAERCRRSVSRMEHDEQNGMSTAATARVIVTRMLRRKPPQVLTVGLIYRLFAFAKRILPVRLVNWVIYGLYAG